MRNARKSSSDRFLSAVLALDFKAKLKLDGNIEGRTNPIFRSFFISSEALDFDRERRQKRLKLILTLKEVLQDLESIRKSLNPEEAPTPNSTTGLNVTQEATALNNSGDFPICLGNSVDLKSFADLAANKSSWKIRSSLGTPTFSHARHRKSSPALVSRQPLENEILPSGYTICLPPKKTKVLRVRASIKDVSCLLSSFDKQVITTLKSLLLEHPFRLEISREGLCNLEAFKKTTEMEQSPLMAIKYSPQQRECNLDDGMSSLNVSDSSYGELWVTANSSMMDSEPSTPTSQQKFSSGSAQNILKRTLLNNAFIASSAKKLFTSAPCKKTTLTIRRNIDEELEELAETQRNNLDESSEASSENSSCVPTTVNMYRGEIMEASTPHFNPNNHYGCSISRGGLIESGSEPTQGILKPKNTTDAAIQTDRLSRTQEINDESIYEHKNMVPQTHKVGLILGNLPDAFSKLSTIVTFLDQHGSLESISVKRKGLWVGFFASYEVDEVNKLALQAFNEKPFGKTYLRDIVNPKLGTYEDFVNSSAEVDPSLKLINPLLDSNNDVINDDEEAYNRVKKFFEELLLNVSSETLLRYMSIIREERKALPKPFVYKLDAVILCEARARTTQSNNELTPFFASVMKFWNETHDRLHKAFAGRFKKNPMSIIELLPIIADHEMMGKFLQTLEKGLDSVGPAYTNLQPVYSQLMKQCSQQFTGQLKPFCDLLINHLKRNAMDKWAAELLTTYGSKDHFKRVCSIFEYKLECISKQDHTAMLECVLVFCNQSGLRDIGFSSILEGLLNLEALTFKQISSIFVSELAQASFESFCRLMSALLEKFIASKNTFEKWILISRMMPQWVGNNHQSNLRRTFIINSLKKVMDLLEEASATYKTKPVQENWRRDPSLLDSWRAKNDHSGCPGCLELRNFLTDPYTVSKNITVNDSGRKCVKKILLSKVAGTVPTTLSDYLNLTFEELDYLQNMKLYQSRRCGAIDVRKNPLSIQQSQFHLQWFDDAKQELRAIIQEIRKTVEEDCSTSE